MELTREQREGLSKFLGVAVKPYSSRVDSWQWAIDRIISTDADLMLALLNRAAELGYCSQSNRNPAFSPHFCIRKFWNTHTGGRVRAGASAGDEFEAVILAALQLPEAQP